MDIVFGNFKSREIIVVFYWFFNLLLSILTLFIMFALEKQEFSE